MTFQGGNSIDARENGANASDCYFMNGNALEGFQEQIEDVRDSVNELVVLVENARFDLP